MSLLIEPIVQTAFAKALFTILGLVLLLMARAVYVHLRQKIMELPPEPIIPAVRLGRLVNDWELRAKATKNLSARSIYETCAAELRVTLRLDQAKRKIMRLKDVPYPQLVWDLWSVEERRTICFSGNDSTRLRSHALAANLWEDIAQEDREVLWQVDVKWAKSRRHELDRS